VSLLFFLLNQKVSISTQYAENQKIQLPDGSFVVLNANSSVSFADDWDEQSPREVWLKGEAFFSVTHTANHQKFIVHTNDLDVQVLGTKFNVNARVSKTRVVLNSGKVKLFLRQEKNQEVDMKPGELVDFSSNNKAFVKKAVKTKVFSAWVNKELVFEDTSLEEIAQLLEDNYGYKVKFVNKELANLTFTGTANTENINLLFTILQKTFNISIQKQENNLIINN
jgi:ferric-dicitrate binding protein FerR (iron transport regulator)